MSTSLETIRRVKSNDPHLHELTISDVVLGDARITLLLASALRDNAHIRHVIISEGGRRVLERADAILDALSSANVVCKITVGPRRGDYVPEQRPAIAMAVADRLHSLASLVKLDLNGCLIGPVGAARLASSLEGNATMTQLLVSDNDIGDEGAAALGRMLRKNGALVEVIMDANDITPRGQRELRNAIYDDSSFAALGGSNHRLESYFHNPRSVFGPCVMNDVLAALASNLRSKSARQAVTKKLTRLLQRRYGVRLQGASFLNVESVFMPPILEWVAGKCDLDTIYTFKPILIDLLEGRNLALSMS